MPWKECNQMDERLRFVARLGVGQRRAAACPAERDVDRQRKAKSRHAHAKKGSNRWWDPIGGLQQRREQASFNVLTHQKIGLWQHVCQARQQGGFVFDRVGDRRAQRKPPIVTIKLAHLEHAKTGNNRWCSAVVVGVAVGRDNEAQIGRVNLFHISNLSETHERRPHYGYRAAGGRRQSYVE